MPVTIVAGGQWGDEGKGRIVDLLAQDADMVIRCQGGPNAGHTVINDRGKFVLHSVPSGVFSERARCVIGAGTVINPAGLAEEMRGLAMAGIDVGRLLISERAQLIMPYHILIERLEEERRSAETRVAPTGQGVGPAYSDKAARRGFRAGDLLDLAQFERRLTEALAWQNRLLATYDRPPLQVDQVMAEVTPAAELLGPYIGDTTESVIDALESGQRVLLEGQLGVMRDLDWGTYPFVTSSSPIPAGMLAGAGVAPRYVDRVIGVVKAYTTSVGASPFPTELTGPEGDNLRETGNEYGATTGRPRRCGWFDAVAVKWAARVAGFTEIALTKLDILNGISPIPICTAYRCGGGHVDAFPTTDPMARVEPVYEEMRGWFAATSAARALDDLPAEARDYVDHIERLAGVPITLVSVGPERESAVTRGAAVL